MAIAGSAGSVSVSGPNSLWENADTLTVGRVSTGELRIADGGTVTNTGGTIGALSGATGTVTVSGTSSSWLISGSLFVGSDGTAALKVEAGGDVTSVDGTVGANSGSSGAVVVSGTSSSWAGSGDLVAGGRGTGVITVADQGVVSALSTTLAAGVGSFGTLNIGAAARSSAVAAGTLDTAVALHFIGFCLNFCDDKGAYERAGVRRQRGRTSRALGSSGPSTCLLLHGGSIALRTASMSRPSTLANRTIGRRPESIATSIQASSGSDTPARKMPLKRVAKVRVTEIEAEPN
ncbi:T5SS/PEP-CTERM-associated repeat protein [Phyllobacterium trifolii]|uniref:T5SS/PEP-CTERM-associated repeat protein n=1 Tax=Phyllobacterium trifolii TaxID=300193 RepID=A0A839UIN0_9HYPH|nr:T5SS/PEP-CTERM-associated repeat protein [Phyllobacterium trifolii]